MSTSPAAIPETSTAKAGLWWFLGIASLIAVIVVVLFAWIDSRKIPVISFYATPHTQLAVDIRGAVSTPGVVYMEPGDRLIDVVNEAGGLSPDADATLINMSARVTDGQVIVLPTQATASGEPSDERIDINSATADELTQLPGIGDVLAARIVAYREANGPYQSVDDLAEVEGISANKVDELRPYVQVSGND